jgi:uncharacterized membrane protein YdfJ with MMPL/SSD domain
MELRRPIIAFTTALLLVGGGALTACGDPVNSDTGTPRDTASNTSQHQKTQDNSGPQNSSGASRAGSPAT